MAMPCSERYCQGSCAIAVGARPSSDSEVMPEAPGPILRPAVGWGLFGYTTC